MYIPDSSCVFRERALGVICNDTSTRSMDQNRLALVGIQIPFRISTMQALENAPGESKVVRVCCIYNDVRLTASHTNLP